MYLYAPQIAQPLSQKQHKSTAFAEHTQVNTYKTVKFKYFWVFFWVFVRGNAHTQLPVCTSVKRSMQIVRKSLFIEKNLPIRVPCWECRLVAAEEVAGIDFLLYIVQTSVIAVGYDGLGLCFEFV